MKFLLDTDICSAHMRRPAQLAHRFIQHINQLAISTVVLAELYAGAFRHSNSQKLLRLIEDLLQEVHVLDFDQACAAEFGRLRGALLQKGIAVATADLMIASGAVVHDLTLITHNTADFQKIPGLRLEDWLKPWSPLLFPPAASNSEAVPIGPCCTKRPKAEFLNRPQKMRS